MRLPVAMLCLAATALSSTLPALAGPPPTCTQIGFTTPVTGHRELFPPCEDGEPRTCPGAAVGPVFGGPLNGTEVHAYVCLPKPIGR